MRAPTNALALVGLAVCFVTAVTVIGARLLASTVDPTGTEPIPVNGDGPGFIIPSSDSARYAYSSDIFLGQIAARDPATPTVPSRPADASQPWPRTETLYTVVVLQTVKGTASGTVRVRQDGAYDGVSLSPDADPPFLEPGELAVFVAIWVPERGWYDLFQGRYGHIRVASGSEQATVVARFSDFTSTATAFTTARRGATPSPSTSPTAIR